VLLKLKPASASQVIGALYKCLLYNRLLGRSQFSFVCFRKLLTGAMPAGNMGDSAAGGGRNMG
jgi:hypothetical protein